MAFRGLRTASQRWLMRRPGIIAALLLALAPPATAADLVYPGPKAAAAADTVRARLPGLDRGVALPNVATVADAVRSGQAADGLIPSLGPGGMPGSTIDLLLLASDPGLRIVSEVSGDDAETGHYDYWVVAKPVERWAEQHPDRLVLTIDAPADSKAFSLIFAGLAKLGFMVTWTGAVPLGGNPYGFRYLALLAADKPLLVLRVTDQLARDSRAGGGRAVLIGAWKQVH